MSIGIHDGFSGIFSEKQWQRIEESFALSPRQAEIVHCIFRGRSDKQIAAELGIAVSTVRTYLSRIFIRFETQDRVELILHVLQGFFEECRQHNCDRVLPLANMALS